MIYLLDTNTLVYALNRQGGVRERVNDAALRNRSATSSIVVAELLYGAGRSSRPEENRKVVLRGIERFQIVPFTFATAEHFARLMTDLAARGKTHPRFDPSSTCQVLLAAGKHLVIAGRPLLYADSGVENVNSAVDGTLFSACLERILAQVEVAFSNSLIEAHWRSLKHQWLFLNTLDSVARVRAMVEFYVNEHNTKMPHPAFSGQTPDEMFFGTGAKVPEELALAKGNARAARMADNRAMSCERCLGQQATLPGETIPH